LDLSALLMVLALLAAATVAKAGAATQFLHIGAPVQQVSHAVMSECHAL
jgi:hypothetical protein